jgi:hypothetical protein
MPFAVNYLARSFYFPSIISDARYGHHRYQRPHTNKRYNDCAPLTRRTVYATINGKTFACLFDTAGTASVMLSHNTAAVCDIYSMPKAEKWRTTYSKGRLSCRVITYLHSRYHLYHQYRRKHMWLFLTNIIKTMTTLVRQKYLPKPVMPSPF